MSSKISPRIAGFVDALPLKAGIRVLEIGCGPGVAAREVARLVGDGFVLAIDRSAPAIEQARQGSRHDMQSGRLDFRLSAIEDFTLETGENPFDLAFAMRVGALDGRHPEIAQLAIARIRAALIANGKLFIDGGNPLKEVDL